MSKNLLLHARAGSKEPRPVDINAIVEESLNLAYHGARAEKQGFNITLARSFDPAVGQADVFPQDITRVLPGSWGRYRPQPPQTRTCAIRRIRFFAGELRSSNSV